MHERSRRPDCPLHGDLPAAAFSKNGTSQPAITRLAALTLIVAVGIAATGLVQSVGEEPADVPKLDAAALAALVQNAEKVEPQTESWGWLRWLMSSKIDPKAEMTFGLAQVAAGHRNPMHVHPNCEEILYVLSGSCEHFLGDQKVTLREGDMIRIPRGMPHCAKVLGEIPMKSVIVYSSADRQFVEVAQ